jgi:hypothetical protein
MPDQSAHCFADELKRDADRIYNLIFHSDLEWIDIEIQIDRMRERCREVQPEDIDLFEAIYAGRFARLLRQLRWDGDTSWTWRDRPDEPLLPV